VLTEIVLPVLPHPNGSYADWTVPELKKRAKELGMSGYSDLTKDKLIAKLRNH
jgi:hypothetical protein